MGGFLKKGHDWPVHFFGMRVQGKMISRYFHHRLIGKTDYGIGPGMNPQVRLYGYCFGNRIENEPQLIGYVVLVALGKPGKDPVENLP
jgi:hypothetical protein